MMEYVDGLTLGAFVEENPAYFKSVQNANRFLTQLLEVVGYLHQHQIVHLDLKPSNILITRIGHDVKLADLGYCYTDTYTDTMGRTDKYAAPEQIHGEQVDARTDIYAIGKLMESLPCHHINNKVIARCTAPSPSNRYQTIEELQNALKPSAHFKLIVMGLLLISMVLLGGYLMTRNHEDSLDSKQDHDPIPVILPAQTS
jgi:serine/threonine protein kinase